MAAVTFHQEEALNKLTDADDGTAYLTSGEHGIVRDGLVRLRRKGNPGVAVKPYVLQAHQKLARAIFDRAAVQTILQQPGRTVQVVWRGADAVLAINPPVELSESPPWSPLPARYLGQSLLSGVAKMGCPSFSLPAGPGIFGGACPGATQGMTILPAEILHNQAAKRRIMELTGMHREVSPEEWYGDSVCQSCYAEGGSYSRSNNQLAGLARLIWAKQAVADGTFARTMVEAIERSSLYASGDDARLLHPLGYKRVFRIHDAGDFFSREYAAAWKQVTDHFMPGGGRGTPTIFWAPTRLWAAGTQQIRDWTKVFGPAGDLRQNNVVIRPSAYHLNRPAPAPQLGESHGSTVHKAETAEEVQALLDAKLFHYACPATAKGSDKKTCLTVTGPDGGTGCRVCWVQPSTVVSYHVHK